MMENFKMTCFMDMVSLAFHPILIMKDTTTNNNFMHMDCKHFHLVMYMRVNITMEKCKGMEFTHFLMEANMKDPIKTINNMVLVSGTRMVRSLKESIVRTC